MAGVERQPSETDLLRKKVEEEIEAMREKRNAKTHRNDGTGPIERQRLLDTDREYEESEELDEGNRGGSKRSHSNVTSETTSATTSASSSGIEITEQLEGLSLKDDGEFPELRKRPQREKVPIKDPRKDNNTTSRVTDNFRQIAGIITQSSLTTTPTLAETMAPTISRELRHMAQGPWRDQNDESGDSMEESDEDIKLIKVQARISERALGQIETYKHNEKILEGKIDEQEEIIKDLSLKIMARQEDTEQREAEREQMRLTLRESTERVKELEEKELTMLTWMEKQLGTNREQIDELNEELETAKESLDASDRKKEQFEEELRMHKEQMERLTRKNLELSNKEKRRRLALEENNALSRYVSTASLRDGPRVLPIEDDTYNQVIPDQEEHTKQQRKEYMQGEFKRLEATKWPYPENFATHGDFYAIVVSHAKKLVARGHPQDLIAESLDNFLMSSKKAPKYGAIARVKSSETLKGVLEALQSCDIAYCSTTMEERFNNVKRYRREDWETYMARCKTLYSNLGGSDPNHDKAKARRIKERFFGGAGIAKSYADKFMAQNDLDELVTQVIRDDEAGVIVYGNKYEGDQEMWRGRQQRSTWGMTRNPPRDQMQTRRIVDGQIMERFKAQTQTRPQVQVQQQNQNRVPDRQSQPLRTIQREAPVLAVQNERQPMPTTATMTRTKSAPKGTFRMPIGEEHKGRSGVSFCLRCRQKPHTSMECTFCRYCSYCDRETGDGEVDHTNKMHLELMEKGKGEIIARHRAERNRKTYSNE